MSGHGSMARRQFLAAIAAGLGGTIAVHDAGLAREQGLLARLRSRPAEPGHRADPGRHALPDAAGEGSWLHVPAGLTGRQGRVPLIVVLHGAGRTLPPMERLTGEADRRSFAVAVPMAAEHTWDLMLSGRYGSDVLRLDAALAAVFERVPVDPARLCLAGFSDGASYALSVGLQNGDLFSHLMAFSPGFIGPGRPTGRPRVFISHGRQDRILPIERTTARIRDSLETRSIEVRYYEFEGGHGVPAAAEAAALDWLLGD